MPIWKNATRRLVQSVLGAWLLVFIWLPYRFLKDTHPLAGVLVALGFFLVVLAIGVFKFRHGYKKSFLALLKDTLIVIGISTLIVGIQDAFPSLRIPHSGQRFLLTLTAVWLWFCLLEYFKSKKQRAAEPTQEVLFNVPELQENVLASPGGAPPVDNTEKLEGDVYCPKCGVRVGSTAASCYLCGAAIDDGGPAVPRPTPNETAASRSYVARHWRGELSLPTSFWVNTVGVAVSFGLLVTVLNIDDLFVSNFPRLFSTTMILTWVLAVPIQVWQTVGLWRCTRNYLRRGNSMLVGRFVQFLVIAGALNSLRVFIWIGVPQVAELSKFARGMDSAGSYQVRVLGEKDLEITGVLTFGITDEVRKVLDEQPSIKIIHLNSPGGRIAEARKLRDLITLRSLTTYTSDGCASACTLAYAAGKERLIGQNAKLGFHRYSFPGVNDNEAIYAKDKKDWLSRGFNPDFVSKAFLTPHEELWTPTHKELLKAGIVTRYASNKDVQSGGPQYSDRQQLEAELSRELFFAALKDNEPETYRQWVLEIWSGLQQGKNMASLQAEFRPRIAAMYKQKLPYVSDSVARNVTTLVMAEMKFLQTVGPGLCYDYLFTSDQFNGAKYFSPELLKKETAMIAEVIKSGRQSGKKPPEQQMIFKQMSAVMNSIVQKYGEDGTTWIQNPELGKRDKSKMCEIVYDLYQEVLRLPESDSGAMLRFLFVGGK